jgi:hypothetical protein
VRDQYLGRATNHHSIELDLPSLNAADRHFGGWSQILHIFTANHLDSDLCHLSPWPNAYKLNLLENIKLTRSLIKFPSIFMTDFVLAEKSFGILFRFR